MFKWYRQSWNQVLKELDSNSYYGLYGEQIEPHRKKYGSNEIMLPYTRNFFPLILRQFGTIWIILVLLFTGSFIYFHFYLDTVAISCILLIDIFCMTLEQYNAQKDIVELKKLNIGNARVIREERTVRIPLEELVVGDIVIVAAGESVPADIRIIESNDLKVDECSVTGEKFLSDKYAPKIQDKEISLSDMKNILFKSSAVAKGDATGVVVAVGMKTQVAGIVKLLMEQRQKQNFLKSIIDGILNTYMKILFSGVLILTFLDYQWNRNLTYLLKQFFFVSASAVPLGIVLILYVINNILLNGIKKNNNIDFKDLFSIQKFSNVSVICTDKIGGFSRKRMDVVKAYGNDSFIDIYGDESKEDGINENLYRMLNIGLLCMAENPKDDLGEISIAKFAKQNGIYKNKVEREHRRIFQISFDTERRIMTSVNKMDKHYRANVKGAVDSILERCTHIMKNGIELEITEDDINSIRDADISMSNDSLNVLGFAYRNFSYEPSLKENIESNLVFVGLIGFDNKLKEFAGDYIKKSEELYIKPVIITDDSKLTALAVGKKLGIVSGLNQILSGVEMDNMEEEEFNRIGEKINIFSRISSKNKIEIIKALKSYGHITAITGWRLTDLPALGISDIGISSSKSNIVKRLCDIFMEDIDFMNFLNLIETCRNIMIEIKKILVYLSASSFGLLIFLIINMLNKSIDINNGLFLKSAAFNVITMFLSSLTIICQYNDEEAEDNNFLINSNIIKDRISFVFVTGTIMAVLAFAAFKIADFCAIGYASQVPFAVLNFCGVFFVYSFSDTMVFRNRMSNIIVLMNCIFQVFIIVLSGKLHILFNISYWLVVFIFSIIWFMFCLVYKFHRKDYYMD